MHASFGTSAQPCRCSVRSPFFQLFRLQGPEQNALGNVLVACLLAGISTGVALDWLWLIGKGW
jgi:hypothetical protein